MTTRFAFSFCAALALATLITACRSNTVGDNRDDIKAPLQEPLPGSVDIDGDETVFTPEKKSVLTVPVTPSNTQLVADPAPVIDVKPFVAQAVAPIQYVVKKGDSPWLIAEMYGVRVAELMAANKISNANKLHVGQKLTIPAGGAFVEPSKRKVYKAPAQTKVEKKTTVSKTTKSTKSFKPTSHTNGSSSVAISGNEYTVSKGDFPAKIAKKAGCSTADLLAANGLNEKSMLQIGQKLKLPSSAKATQSTESTSTTTAVAPVETTTSTSTTTTESTPISTTTTATAPVATGDIMEAEEGETLRKISSMFNFSLDELVKLNPQLSPDQELKKGTVVKMPSF